jgi:cytochrome b involved in lipid metabolism
MTKKLTTISLIIFCIIVTAILSAGLVFYQNKKDNQATNSGTNNLAQETLNQIKPTGGSLVLNMSEIAKHNKTSNCWMLISGKVYNITGYFGSHPGGNATMAATCGTDATAAYKTKDPYAATSGGGTTHSSSALSLLTNYYIGDLNQTISTATNNSNITNNTNTNIVSNKNTTPTSPVASNKPTTIVGNVTLNMTEIAKHNKQTDCWMLISGKVYNITSYFGSHPGGNSPMTATCGIDATAAYATKNAGATSSGARISHSSNALSLLTNYYIGDLNQTIGTDKVIQTNTVVSPISRGDDDEWDD